MSSKSIPSITQVHDIAVPLWKMLLLWWQSFVLTKDALEAKSSVNIKHCLCADNLELCFFRYSGNVAFDVLWQWIMQSKEDCIICVPVLYSHLSSICNDFHDMITLSSLITFCEENLLFTSGRIHCSSGPITQMFSLMLTLLSVRSNCWTNSQVDSDFRGHDTHVTSF